MNRDKAILLRIKENYLYSIWLFFYFDFFNVFAYLIDLNLTSFPSCCIFYVPLRLCKNTICRICYFQIDS